MDESQIRSALHNALYYLDKIYVASNQSELTELQKTKIGESKVIIREVLGEI